MMKKWANEFRRRRENMYYYEWSGCPKEASTDKNIELVHNLTMCNRRRSLHDRARHIGIRFGVVLSILTNIRDVQGLSWMGPQNVDQRSKIRRRAGLIFLSCLSMRMTLILCIEL